MQKHEMHGPRCITWDFFFQQRYIFKHYTYLSHLVSPSSLWVFVCGFGFLQWYGCWFLEVQESSCVKSGQFQASL
jgi:hypothetical protein